jgi:hypothetical protein
MCLSAVHRHLFLLLAGPLVLATATIEGQPAQKPTCGVSEFARAAERGKPASALAAPDNSSDVSADLRKAAAADARKAIAQAQTETAQRMGQPKGGFLTSLFSPSDPAKASNVDRKRADMAVSLEKTYLVPVLEKYHVSCAGLRTIVDNEKPAATATPSK